MKFSIVQHAPDEFTKFAKGAYQGSVGKQLTVNTPRGAARGTLVSATVQDDGRAIELTFDVPGMVFVAERADPFARADRDGDTRVTRLDNGSSQVT